jgi:hypothetical protein
MDDDMFVYKSYLEVIITSDVVSSDEIQKDLGLVPHRTFNKGDEVTSKHTGRIIKRMNNLWAIRSKVIVSNEEDVSCHIEYLRELLKTKLDLLSKYKRNPDLEVVIWVWIETDNAGIGFQFKEDELSFFNEIANRVQFSLITNKTDNIQK